ANAPWLHGRAECRVLLSPGALGLLRPGRCRRTRLNGMEGSAENIAVRDNPSESRYELVLDEQVVGEIAYRLRPEHIVLIHTEILPSLENKGLGVRLVAGALDDIRARGLRVLPF